MAQRLTSGALPERLQNIYFKLTTNSKAQDPGPRHEVTSSFTGEPVGFIHEGDEDTVELAFGIAREAQARWAQVPVKQRQAIFRDFHDRVLANKELLMDIVQLETGKNRASALDEVMDVVTNTRYYANQAPKLLGEHSRPGALPVLTRSFEQRVPKGVVGQISPWNYPLALGISDAIPALLAGNAVVAKPDSSTPFSQLSVLHLLYLSGLPRDLMQVVTGTGRVVGSAIAEHCDYLMFTGSTATGKILGKTAGERLIGYSAELGGKNPMIIAEDADMDLVVREAVNACFANSGQLCVSIERIYVAAPLFDEFVRRFAAAVDAMKLAAGFDWNADMGSLINQQQLDTVSGFVDDARDKGATVVTGGNPRPDLGPFFYEPTVLVDVPDNARLRTEEVFGPVVYIEPFDTEDEAVAKANDTDYGLNASVFAASETGQRIARRIDAGGVGINDGYTATWATVSTPLGGMKQSGMARRHGPEGMLKYTEPKNVAEQRIMSMRGPQSMSRRTYATVMTTALKLGKRFLP